VKKIFDDDSDKKCQRSAKAGYWTLVQNPAVGPKLYVVTWTAGSETRYSGSGLIVVRFNVLLSSTQKKDSSHPLGITSIRELSSRTK
jgi:hypothetical protein